MTAHATNVITPGPLSLVAFFIVGLGLCFASILLGAYLFWHNVTPNLAVSSALATIVALTTFMTWTRQLHRAVWGVLTLGAVTPWATILVIALQRG